MAGAQAVTVINRPAAVVFAFLLDWRRGTEWQQKLLKVEQTSDGPVGVGTTVKEVRSLLGRRIETAFEVTEFELDRKISFESIGGPFPMWARYNLAPLPEGTEVAITVEAELTGIYKMTEPLVIHSAKIQLESDFALLKQLLETPTEPSLDHRP